MPIEFPSSDQLQHYIVQRFGNTLCFQPDLAVGRNFGLIERRPTKGFEANAAVIRWDVRTATATS
jgi:hypothetical protein